MDINDKLSTISTKLVDYDKHTKEFYADISTLAGQGNIFSPIFIEIKNMCGFWLKSHKTGAEVLMQLRNTIREDGEVGDILYWVFVPVFLTDREKFSKFILFND